MSLPHVDHIGIIVEDVEKSVELFESVLGFESVSLRQMDEVGLKIATLRARNIDIELIQYLDSENNFGKKTMGSSIGVNHFSIHSENVKTSIDSLSKKGVRVMEGFPQAGNHGSVAFFKKKTTGNILFEICGKLER